MPFVTSQGDIADTYQKASSAIAALTTQCGGADGDERPFGGDRNPPGVILASTSESERTDEDTHAQHLQYRYIDELQLLEIWNSEHGVSAGELDHKLREASLLRDRILELLNSLIQIADPDQNFLSDSCDVGETSHHDKELFAIPVRSKSSHVGSRSPDRHSVSDMSSSGIDTSISLSVSEPYTMDAQIHDTISLLLELGPSLLDPAPHDRLSQATSLNAAQPDIDHACAKFPKADPKLICRAGIANWERRQALRNLRIEFDKGTQCPPLVDPFQEDGDERLLPSRDDFSRSSSNSAARMSAEITQALDMSSISTSDEESDFEFEDVKTVSTPFTEVTAPTAHLHVVDNALEPRYRIPPPPRPNEDYVGKEFLCPYCFRRLSGIRTSHQWTKHVFGDLEPYMCTYGDCKLPGKTYGDKRIWWEHEIKRHRVTQTWICQPCTHQDRGFVFDSALSFDNHIREHHPVLNTEEQMRGIRDMCQQSSDVSKPNLICPFCQDNIKIKESKDSGETERSVRNHVAEHFEQLAFFVAFPAGRMIVKDDESEFADDSDSESGQKTEIESAFSNDKYQSRQAVGADNVNRYFQDQRRTKSMVSMTDALGNSTSQNEKSEVLHNDLEISHQNFPIRILMHPPNEHFYGRDDLVEEAREFLSMPGRICLFHGVGGIGKTLTAVEFIYKNQESYDAIFWLQADTAPGLSESYLQMTAALGLINGSEDHSQAMDKGRTWLQDTEKRWLLIFDNALTWEMISPFMPNNFEKTNGSVLITMQQENVPLASDNFHKIRLNALDRDAGSEMLLRYLNQPVEENAERDRAREISTFVGGLPVAIAHVAGYAGFSQYSLEELIETFREWRKRTGLAVLEDDDLPLSFRESIVSYDETLAMVWNVTLRELSRDAQDVMYILSYLNCEAIPQSMLWGIHEEPSLHFLDVREKLRLRRIKDSLISRRLVHFKKVDNEMCFSIHRSLQRGIREGLSLDPEKQQTVFGQALALLREVFPRSNPLQQPMPDQWSEYQRLLPHLHALHDVYQRAKPHIKGSVDFAQLLQDAGMDQHERGITKEGLLLLKTAEEVLDAVAPDDHHVMRADIHAMIAIMYDNAGIETRQEAFERRKIALKIRKQVVDDSSAPRRNDEILLYNSWMEYAISLLQYHRFTPAEAVVERCRQKYTEWGTEEEIPFEYAKYYNKMGWVRMYQGRFDEAIPLAKRGAQLMLQTGYLLFETRYGFDAACVILQSGDVDGALAVQREIYDFRLDKLGQTNELTLHSCYAVGAIYEIKGELEHAILWYRKALDQRRGVSSWPDEAFYRAQYHLSKVLLLRGRPEDTKIAQDLRDKASRVLHKLLPLDRPPELADCDDEVVLFDHIQTISGARFTGQELLHYFMKQEHESVSTTPL